MYIPDLEFYKMFVLKSPGHMHKLWAKQKHKIDLWEMIEKVELVREYENHLLRYYENLAYVKDRYLDDFPCATTGTRRIRFGINEKYVDGELQWRLEYDEFGKTLKRMPNGDTYIWH